MTNKAKIEMLPIYDRLICYTNHIPSARKALNRHFGEDNIDLLFIEGVENTKGCAAPIPCNNIDGVLKAFVMYVQDSEGSVRSPMKLIILKTSSLIISGRN